VRNLCILAAGLLSLCAGAPPVVAQTITDGDTLKLNGVTYRLWGVDAPETKQDCPDGWAAGRLATTHLQSRDFRPQCHLRAEGQRSIWADGRDLPSGRGGSRGDNGP